MGIFDDIKESITNFLKRLQLNMRNQISGRNINWDQHWLIVKYAIKDKIKFMKRMMCQYFQSILNVYVTCNG